jgi:hypothetical protein
MLRRETGETTARKVGESGHREGQIVRGWLWSPVSIDAALAELRRRPAIEGIRRGVLRQRRRL